MPTTMTAAETDRILILSYPGQERMLHGVLCRGLTEREAACEFNAAARADWDDNEPLRAMFDHSREAFELHCKKVEAGQAVGKNKAFLAAATRIADPDARITLADGRPLEASPPRSTSSPPPRKPPATRLAASPSSPEPRRTTTTSTSSPPAPRPETDETRALSAEGSRVERDRAARILALALPGQRQQEIARKAITEGLSTLQAAKRLHRDAIARYDHDAQLRSEFATREQLEAYTRAVEGGRVAGALGDELDLATREWAT